MAEKSIRLWEGGFHLTDSIRMWVDVRDCPEPQEERTSTAEECAVNNVSVSQEAIHSLLWFLSIVCTRTRACPQMPGRRLWGPGEEAAGANGGFLSHEDHPEVLLPRKGSGSKCCYYYLRDTQNMVAVKKIPQTKPWHMSHTWTQSPCPAEHTGAPCSVGIATRSYTHNDRVPSKGMLISEPSLTWGSLAARKSSHKISGVISHTDHSDRLPSGWMGHAAYNDLFSLTMESSFSLAKALKQDSTHLNPFSSGLFLLLLLPFF